MAIKFTGVELRTLIVTHSQGLATAICNNSATREQILEMLARMHQLATELPAEATKHQDDDERDDDEPRPAQKDLH